MALRTRDDYLASLRALRPNLYKFGALIEDVTTHPATRRTVESHARVYDAAHDPANASLFTATSHLSGGVCHRFNTLMATQADVIANARLKRTMYRLTGTCTGGACVGWNALNTLWAVTHELDVQAGTGYHERLKAWALYAEARGLMVAGALTDPKGDRSKPPSLQDDPDMNVHIAGERTGGIIVRGAKAMICGVAASHEIFVLPGAAYKEADRAYAVAFVIPRDADGLTIIETRRPSDCRELEDGFDVPDTGITQAYLIFDDVYVPNERVFLCGEHGATGKVISYFTATYRACIGACVAGQGDVMIGAALLMARANGLSQRTFQDKLVQMVQHNETTYGLGIGAIAMGRAHPSGVWLSDALLAHTNKILVGTLPYETKRLCQEIGGGIVETGCLPSCRDLTAPELGGKVAKYVKAAVPAEPRARAARLAEWLTIGAGVPGCMHGGGSPDGARLVLRALTPWEEYAAYARRLAGIEVEIPEPTKDR